MSNHLDSLEYTRARFSGTALRLAFPLGAKPEAVGSWRSAARAKLVELLGPLPTNHIPPVIEEGPARVRPDHRRIPVTFATRPDLAAFGYLLIPDGLTTPRPAVLCLPGHGRGVDEIVGIDAEGRDRDAPDGYQRDFAVQCVERGYVTLALEMLGFGHRRDEAARRRGAEASSCQPAAGAALLLGETMVGWRVWDAIRAIDVLVGRPEVDAERIAVMGISGGGTVALYTAALDERIHATMLSCSFCTFRDSIGAVSHCIDNYVPGILHWFEMADLTGLIAPRFVFCESGTDDEIFPAMGVRDALARAGLIYETFGVPERLRHEFFEGGHQFHGSAAFAQLGRWLGMEGG